MPPLAPPDPDTFGDLTAAERASLAAMEHAKQWEDGYSAEQSTRPQTLGHGLTDSPACTGRASGRSRSGSASRARTS
ncbi:hypothetical protein [Nonomuraea endophytica]|uniref:Uncharacterized protein n=1 Tax=Nonomuraea endophytica TaxID=714136 RepID=A0A7W8EFS7_9ACTN|nr:hypothetical protein [Nonomuraea endophytica]MBB5077874.1 hypothetical protein [Nonomuraea endophytica]